VRCGRDGVRNVVLYNSATVGERKADETCRPHAVCTWFTDAKALARAALVAESQTPPTGLALRGLLEYAARHDPKPFQFAALRSELRKPVSVFEPRQFVWLLVRTSLQRQIDFLQAFSAARPGGFNIL
jgi:hypothetical protein